MQHDDGRPQAASAAETLFAAASEQGLDLSEIASLAERLPQATGRSDLIADGSRVAVIRFEDGSGVGIHHKGIDILEPE